MKIFVVQYDNSGTIYEPRLFVDKNQALDCRESLMIEQGMRQMNDYEKWEHYLDVYENLIAGGASDEEQDASPEFDPDDYVRFWEVEI